MSQYPIIPKTEELIILPRAVRSASVQSEVFVNEHHRGIYLFVAIYAVPGVDTITTRILIVDPISKTSARWLVSSPALSTADHFDMSAYPGGTGDTYRLPLPLPRLYQVNVDHSGAGNFDYSVGAMLMP